MKITATQLHLLAREAVTSTMPRSPYEVIISQGRDKFTVLMRGGSYYEDSDCPAEDEDPSTVLAHFKTEEEARQLASDRLAQLDSDDHLALNYRDLTYKFGPRGNRILIDEAKP